MVLAMIGDREDLNMDLFEVKNGTKSATIEFHNVPPVSECSQSG
jgi:hypothetical protein